MWILHPVRMFRRVLTIKMVKWGRKKENSDELDMFHHEGNAFAVYLVGIQSQRERMNTNTEM